MPLVSCPDCGHQVSTSADRCPQCNRPMGLPAGPAPGGGPGAEEVVWSGVPSLKAMVGQIAGAAVYAIGLPIAALLLFEPAFALVTGLGRGPAELARTNRSTIVLAVTAAIGLVVVLRVVKLGWRIAVLRSHRYRVSNQRIVLESGVLNRRLDEIDMRLVEDIEFQQTFFERLLGVGQLLVVSADRKMSRIRLLGVENPREIRELIRTNAFAATRSQLFTRST